MPPPRQAGDTRGANWNLFSKNSRTIISSLDISRLPIWAWATKPPRLTLSSGPWPPLPIEKDAVFGPTPIEVLARVAAQNGGARPRHCRFTETALDTVRRRFL